MAEPALSVVETTPAPEVVDQVVLLPVDAIDDSGRLRPIDPVWAAALGRIRAVEGEDEPISVCRLPGRTGWKLIAGGHRLAGARLEGWSHIKAVVKSADALERRRREVSENLWRKGLDPLDRAAFVAELHELLRAKAGLEPIADGRAVSIAVRWQKALRTEATDTNDTMSLVYGFTTEIGASLDLTKRSIERDLQLHRRLAPDVAALLRGLPIGRNAAQLRALTKLSEADQRRAAALIVEGRAKSAGEAIKIVQGGLSKPLDQQDVYFNRAAALWTRLSAKTKRLVISEIIAGDPGLPSDLRALFWGPSEETGDATQVDGLLSQTDRVMVDARPEGLGADAGRGGAGKGRRPNARPGREDRPAPVGGSDPAAVDAPPLLKSHALGDHQPPIAGAADA